MTNFGTESGYDIVSEDEGIICECFAATTFISNRKLEHDVLKVYTNNTAVSKYVIYYVTTPEEKHVENFKDNYRGIEIIALESL